MSNGLLSRLYTLGSAALTEVPATAPQSQPAQPENLTMLVVVLAVGTVALVWWLAPRLMEPRRLRLSDVPPRLNELTIFHIIAPLVPAVFVQLIAMSVAQSAFSLDVKSAQGRVVAGLAFQAGAIAGAIAIAKRAFRAGLQSGLGLTLGRLGRDTMAGLLGYLVIMPIVYMMLRVGETFLPEKRHSMLDALGLLHDGWFWLVVVSAVVLAPVAEEIFFRGLVQTWLRRHMSAWGALLVTSAAFALMHTSEEPQTVPALFTLSVALGYVYERTGRLWGSIVLHAVFNGLNIVMFLTGS